jgi:hypothetical protein
VANQVVEIDRHTPRARTRASIAPLVVSILWIGRRKPQLPATFRCARTLVRVYNDPPQNDAQEFGQFVVEYLVDFEANLASPKLKKSKVECAFSVEFGFIYTQLRYETLRPSDIQVLVA